MFQLSTEETYQDGQVIFKEGASGDWIYVVETGEVEIRKQVGDKSVLVDTVRQGEVFGEMSFIANTPRSATAVAKGETTVGAIDRTFLDSEFNKLTGSFRAILKSLTIRLRQTTEKALQVKLRRASERYPRVLSLTINTASGLVRSFSEDMSIGGMFIRTTNPPAVGDTFSLKLKLPERDDPLTIGCEVSWTRGESDDEASPAGMGVRFVEIAEADQKLLKDELKKNIQRG
jgi:CRP/FNR family cyclic AMP-dependent transcriptional regulator